MRRIAAAAISALALGFLSGSAFAFSDEPAPDGPGAQSQFSDPDAAIENLANSASGGSGTDMTTGAQLPSGAGAARVAPAAPGDAEPVNPGWPAWMVWHQ
jgi:hypothetical protein